MYEVERGNMTHRQEDVGIIVARRGCYQSSLSSLGIFQPAHTLDSTGPSYSFQEKLLVAFYRCANGLDFAYTPRYCVTKQTFGQQVVSWEAERRGLNCVD